MADSIEGFLSSLINSGTTGTEKRQYNAPPAEKEVDLRPAKVIPKLNEQVVDYIPPHLLPTEFRDMYANAPNPTPKPATQKNEVVSSNKIKEGFLKGRKFRGIKDDYLGIVSTYSHTLMDENVEYVVLINGTRINKDLIYEYFVDAGFDMNTIAAEEEVKPMINEAPIALNPIALILDSALPVIKTVDFKYEITVPTNELHTILRSSFMDADEKMLNYIIGKISKDDLYNSFVEQLKEYLVRGYSMKIKVHEPIITPTQVSSEKLDESETEDIKKKSNSND